MKHVSCTQTYQVSDHSDENKMTDTLRQNLKNLNSYLHQEYINNVWTHTSIEKGKAIDKQWTTVIILTY